MYPKILIRQSISSKKKDISGQPIIYSDKLIPASRIPCSCSHLIVIFLPPTFCLLQSRHHLLIKQDPKQSYQQFAAAERIHGNYCALSIYMDVICMQVTENGWSGWDEDRTDADTTDVDGDRPMIMLSASYPSSPLPGHLPELLKNKNPSGGRD